MPSLTLKDLPSDVHRALKERAARNSRSLNAEAIDCLRRAVQAHRIDPDELLARARRLREQVGFRLTAREIRAARDRGRS
jgi:plasmid stability protein